MPHPSLASAGYRVIKTFPHSRGYGTTTFLSADTVRNGEQAAVALDTIALMDALKIKQAVIGGFDWGARTAAVVAALWPERCKGLVSVSGYLIGNPYNVVPLAPAAEHAFWYSCYFATDYGCEGYAKNTHEFNKLICGSSRHRSGISMKPLTNAAPRPSPTPIMWPS